MANLLNGKKAIVTGGSRGIGGAIVRRFANEGADIVFTHLGEEAWASEMLATIEAAGRTGAALRADASDSRAAAAGIEEAAAILGGIDILVHNAGLFSITPAGKTSKEDYRKLFSVNVEGVFVGTETALPHIRDNGRIVLIGSVNAHAMPFNGGAVYGAAKAAVAGFARGWARDLAPRGILVNVIQPGPVDTDMNPADGDHAASLTSRMALGRFGRPEEIANLATFLASDESSFITGTCIDIDGGLSI